MRIGSSDRTSHVKQGLSVALLVALLIAAAPIVSAPTSSVTHTTTDNFNTGSTKTRTVVSQNQVRLSTFRISAWARAVTNTPPRAISGISMAYHPSTENIVLFGGYKGSEPSENTTWLYKPLTGRWENIDSGILSTVRPAAKRGITLVYDPKTDNIIFFGGNNGSTRENDTLMFNPAARTWENLITTQSTPISLRSDYGMVYDPITENIIMFGGTTVATGIRETWMFNTITRRWDNLNIATQPSARYNVGMVYDPITENVVLYGGRVSANEPLFDTWMFKPSTRTWENVTPATRPEQRYAHSMVYDPFTENIVMFGGFTDGTGNQNDTWMFNPSARTWNDVTVNRPLARSGAGMTYASNIDKIVMFGGNGATYYKDTWTYRSALYFPAVTANDDWLISPEIDNTANRIENVTATWNAIVPFTAGVTVSVSNNGASFPNVDNATEKVLGTKDSKLQYRISMTIPLKTWENMALGDSTPPPLRYYSMAYDPKTENIVLYGGLNAAATRDNNIWMFKSSARTWENLKPTSFSGYFPRARYGAAMAYDPKTENIVLFGGYSTIYENETWMFNPSTRVWENIAVTVNGATIENLRGRSGATMVYDPKTENIILFGGYSGAYENETWMFNPSTRVWENIAVTVKGATIDNLRRRLDAMMVYDPKTENIVLFGGLNGVTYENETWMFNPATRTWENLVVTRNNYLRPLAKHAMVYDAVTENIILFGGQDPDNFYNETWAFDTINRRWENLAYTGNATIYARSEHKMMYDPKTENMILFSGQAGGATVLDNDTWMFKSILDNTPTLLDITLQYEHSIPVSLTSPADDLKTADSTPDIQLDNTYIVVNYEIWIDDDSSFASPVRENDNDNFHTMGTLADGRYYWKARVWKENENHYSDFSNATRTITVDTTAPAAPSSVSVTPSSWSSTNLFKVSWTNPSDLTGVTGVYYKFNTAPTSSTDGTLASGTDLTFINVTAPVEGTNTIYVWLVDAVGNTSTTNKSSALIYYDASVPTVTLSSSLGATETATGWTATSTSSSYTITGTVPAGSTVKINGVAVDVSGGTFSLAVSLLGGVNNFTIDITDQAGNTTSKVLSVTYTPSAALPTTPTSTTTNIVLMAGAAIFLVVAALAVIYSFVRPKK
ncbi:MAG: kelch repeat-containing protein [Candidatus Hadarchaeota archaeon]